MEGLGIWMMRGMILPAKRWIKTVNVAGATIALVFFVTLLGVQEANAMRWKIKKDVTIEELDKYRAVAVAFLKDIKGWEPDEYTIRYIHTLENAPLAAFNAMRYDAKEEIRQRWLDGFNGFASHPTGELQVFIHTQEMRAFSDYQEFLQIIEDAKKDKTGEVK